MNGSLDWLRPGALPSHILRKLADPNVGIIKGMTDEEKEDIDPSTFDLHVSDEGWTMEKGSIKGVEGKNYENVLKDFGEKLPFGNGYYDLDRRKIYVFKLREYLDFTEEPRLHGQATGRSSVGRLDILARLIADKADSYDSVPSKHTGSLYVEVIPISFDVRIPVGFPICQLRIFCGRPALNRIQGQELEEIYGECLLRDERDDPKKIKAEEKQRLRLNLKPDKKVNKICAFRTLISEVKGLTRIDLTGYPKVKTDPHNYWESAKVERNALRIEPEHFHILRSRERLCLPADVAVYCQAVMEELGELRVHYAGFAHPWFGQNRKDGKKSTPLILEVRGHNVNTYLRHGEALATLEFYRMSEPIDADAKKKVEKGSYQEQELALSRYFGKW